MMQWLDTLNAAAIAVILSAATVVAAIAFWDDTAVAAQEPDKDWSPFFMMDDSLVLTREQLAPRTLSIPCGTGNIVIEFATGKVDYATGCAPDEAARAFWRAVETTWPEWCAAKRNERTP